ncbi:MAG TPA: cytidylate kinase-like family protein [Gemmataceae bacterium]|nr:cytidylate kinase-like family protein [Gemmataceae bacterium]
MIERSLPERTSEAVLRAFHHWEARRRAEAAKGGPVSRGPAAFTIALSREAGARGTSVAREVGARLGWPVYDHELVERIAHEMGLRTSLLESVDERRVSWLEECVQTLAAVPAVSESAYVRHLVETVLSLAAHGECIIVGRGAAQILPPATTLRVRLLAALEDRIAVLSQERGIPRTEAARQVEAIDHERAQFIREHFRKDPADPQNYDLILNTSRFTVADCAVLIIEALRRLQARAQEKATARAS